MSLTLIPFAGFYNSFHDAELDSTLERMFCDDSGNTIGTFAQRAHDAMDWRAVHEAYAAEYVARFAHAFGIKDTRFVELNSPREYNFATDRIFADIPDDELIRIRTELPAELAEECAREWFTSRSGFMSYYSPDIAEWGDMEEWDHNQRGCILAAWVAWKWSEQHSGMWDSYAEFDIMENALCNGFADDILSRNCSEFDRLDRVYNFVRERAEQ